MQVEKGYYCDCFQIQRVVLLIRPQMVVNDTIYPIRERSNIQNLVLVHMEITKNAFGVSKQTNTHLRLKSNSMMSILNLINIVVSLLSAAI